MEIWMLRLSSDKPLFEAKLLCASFILNKNDNILYFIGVSEY